MLEFFMTILKKMKFLFSLLFISLFLSSQSYALSNQEIATVINLAGKQRMLTQKMCKEVLFIAKGVNTEANKASLAKSAALFDKTLNGLINGNAELGLSKIEDTVIVQQLNRVDGLWAEFSKCVHAVLNDDTSNSVLTQIAQQNTILLKEMNKAVSRTLKALQMYAKASGNDLDPGMATTINLAGKQRMLTQKMTKELLLVSNGIDADYAKGNLTGTVGLFEKTLKGLVNGDAGLVLPGTTDAAIVWQLGLVDQIWADYKPVLTAVDTSDAGLRKAEKLNLPLLKEMDKAVKMYEKLVNPNPQIIVSN
jgi:nitrate/nitrite-specific signal transduction histidine kinase